MIHTVIHESFGFYHGQSQFKNGEKGHVVIVRELCLDHECGSGVAAVTQLEGVSTLIAPLFPPPPLFLYLLNQKIIDYGNHTHIPNCTSYQRGKLGGDARMSAKILWIKGREALLEHLHSPILRRKVLDLPTHNPSDLTSGPCVANVDLYHIFSERLYIELECNVASFMHPK